MTSGDESAAGPGDLEVLDGPFTTPQLLRIDEALRLADQSTGLTFSVYVGELDEPARAYAEKLHGQLAEPDDSVLLAVSPNQRVLEIVTGYVARRRIPDRAAKLAALSMAAAFGGGDLGRWPGRRPGPARRAGRQGAAPSLTRPPGTPTRGRDGGWSTSHPVPLSSVRSGRRSGAVVGQARASRSRAARARVTPSRPSATSRRRGAGVPFRASQASVAATVPVDTWKAGYADRDELLRRLAVAGRPDLVDDLEVPGHVRRGQRDLAGCWKPSSSARCSQLGSCSSPVSRRHASAFASARRDQRGGQGGLPLAAGGPVAVQLRLDLGGAGGAVRRSAPGAASSAARCRWPARRARRRRPASRAGWPAPASVRAAPTKARAQASWSPLPGSAATRAAPARGRSAAAQPGRRPGRVGVLGERRLGLAQAAVTRLMSVSAGRPEQTRAT